MLALSRGDALSGFLGAFHFAVTFFRYAKRRESEHPFGFSCAKRPRIDAGQSLGSRATREVGQADRRRSSGRAWHRLRKRHSCGIDPTAGRLACKGTRSYRRVDEVLFAGPCAWRQQNLTSPGTRGFGIGQVPGLGPLFCNLGTRGSQEHKF